jgi:hypothetical protein
MLMIMAFHSFVSLRVLCGDGFFPENKNRDSFESRLRDSELGVSYAFISCTRLARRRYSPVAVIKGEAKSLCVHTEFVDYAGRRLDCQVGRAES